ncbi:MAG: LuxR family transcriptional regulator [Parvularculaceae bacterium]|nr:LuxR family transcriptional regulator [Parvularculaceae bacterium]
MNAVGFTTVLYYQLVSNYERLSLEQGERIPAASRRHYGTYRFFDSDPAISRRIGTMRPFTWSDLSTDDLAPGTASLMEDYRREEVEDAVTVPVSHRNGDLAAVVLTRKGAVFEIASPASRKLKLACQALHERHADLAPSEPQRRLSKRELDVMRLAATGKTNAEIAAQLGVSVHTVNTLIRRSYVKLGASNRVEASIKLAFIARRDAED